VLVAGIGLCLPTAGRVAEVAIDIVKAPQQRISAALAPFSVTGDLPAERAETLRSVLAEDLVFSGFFTVQTEFAPETPLNGSEMLGNPTLFDRLLGRGLELLLNVRAGTEGGKFLLEGLVFDTSSRRQVFGKRYQGPDWAGNKMVHILAGDLIQEFAGVKPLTKSRLAFLWNASGKKQVFVGDYRGNDARSLSKPGELALFPEWTADAQNIAYTSFQTGFPQLMLQDADGSYLKVLSSYPGMNSTVSFAPDGSGFLATLSRDGNPEIYKLDLRGKILQRMTYDSAVDTSPCYSPDGQEFVFVSDKGGSPQIYRMSGAGGKADRLTFSGKHNVAPDWSPGGKHIVYSSLQGGGYELMLLNPVTRETVQLTEGPGNKEDPDWGVDDRHVVYTLTRDHKSDLYMIDVYTRETVKLTRGKGDFSSPSWSPIQR
jgi:TolB protein